MAYCSSHPAEYNIFRLKVLFDNIAPAEQPYEVPVLNSSNIEESMKISLSCTANVGKPPGRIKWWRFRYGTAVPSLIATSSGSPPVQTGVCTYNVTFSIQPMVTKDDDQSVWRCSVDNDLLSSVSDINKPYQETHRINVYCKLISTLTIQQMSLYIYFSKRLY